MRIKFSILFFVLVTGNIVAQYLPCKNYTTADGLPNNAVRALFLDSKNMLWVGTENGVSVFENGSFHTITESDGLAQNSCWAISQDHFGTMWFASYGGGITKFDGSCYTVFTKKNGLADNRVRCFYPYKEYLLIGTETGVSIMNLRNNTIKTAKGSLPHFGAFIVNNFFEFHNEIYFSTIHEGIFKINSPFQNPVVIPFMAFDYKQKETDPCFYGISRFNNDLYIGGKGLVSKYDASLFFKKRAVPSVFGQSIVWQFAQDRNATIYAAASGLFENNGGLFQIANRQMVPLNENFGIDSKNILSVVYDKQRDILYAGSSDNGIFEVQLDGLIRYDKFENSAVIDFDLSNNQKVLLRNKGFSIIYSDHILKTVTQSDFKRAELQFIKKDWKKLPSYNDGFFELNYNTTAENVQFYRLVKHDKSFWVSSNIGVFEIDFSGKITNYIPVHTYEFGFTGHNEFFETNPYGGLHLYQDKYRLKSNWFDGSIFAIVKVFNTANKTYLLSAFNGLFVQDGKRFHSYLKEGKFKEKKLRHIAVNDRGQLIIATEFGSVYIVEDSENFKIVKTIPKKSIIGNSILFLEVYKDNILIGTEKGINIYKDGIVRLIDQEQGLKDCEVTSSQIYKNELWLGTKKGVYKLNLTHLIAYKNTVSEIEISKITVNNMPLPTSDYKWFQIHSKTLEYDYRHNTFSIDFVPIGHEFPHKLKFRYRLKKNEIWSPFSDKTNLYLPYLPYGYYNIEVEVFDSNAGKYERFNILKIRIQPPFWLSWWFFVLILLAVTGFGYFLFLRNQRKIKIREKMAELKIEALLSQMNPHFIFNAMNAIQDFVINNDIENSLRYIGEFSKLMRKTLSNSSIQFHSLEDEIEYLESYIKIENMRFGNKIEWKISIDPEVDESYTQVPSMIFQPFIENVFVHAFDDSHRHPKLSVSFTLFSKEILECKISDNGKGISASTMEKAHQSKGIALTRERLLFLQKNTVNPIVTEQNGGGGTAVKIYILIT